MLSQVYNVPYRRDVVERAKESLKDREIDLEILVTYLQFLVLLERLVIFHQRSYPDLLFPVLH